MTLFGYSTRHNDDPKGKPRVYFTCHPDDFCLFFKKIQEDIHRTHDCAIYFAKDMTAEISQDELEISLSQMNLFVVPITRRLLTQPNRAMDQDIAYAKQQRIPILPIMMESNIQELYSQPEKFDKRQFIDPNSQDGTQVRYEDKLKKYLDCVIISPEMAKRVRAAFDAYIFLSYRKKDRRYANELMKMIHQNPECRDIAIWYDEFLTPGENFSDTIQKALHDSQLFALLVTPNVLEEPNGNPNFVMGVEYPEARKSKKTILPVEMVPTDRDALKEKYKDIPNCADPRDDIAFKDLLLTAIQKVATSADENSPEHNFLIGLAYLEGIDVEVNRELGLELITSAANANVLEAMQKLSSYYYAQYDVINFSHWVSQAVRYKAHQHGDGFFYDLTELKYRACCSGKIEDWQEALKYAEEKYAEFYETLGPEDSRTKYLLSDITSLRSRLEKHLS